jgi:hypothetical protein
VYQSIATVYIPVSLSKFVITIVSVQADAISFPFNVKYFATVFLSSKPSTVFSLLSGVGGSGSFALIVKSILLDFTSVQSALNTFK